MPSEPLVLSLAGPAQLVLRAASVSVVIVAAAREIRMTIRGRYQMLQKTPAISTNLVGSRLRHLGSIGAPRLRAKVLATACSDEHGTALARSGQAGRRTRSACSGLWLV